MNNRVKSICCRFMLAYILVIALFYLIVGKQLSFKTVESNQTAVEATQVVGEIIQGILIRQEFSVDIDQINEISLMMGTYNHDNTSTLILRVKDLDSQEVLSEKEFSAQGISDNAYLNIQLDNPVQDIKGRMLQLEVQSNNAVEGNAVTLWYGQKQPNEIDKMYINGQVVDGTLCMNVSGADKIPFTKWYFIITVGFGAVLGICWLHILKKYKAGKRTLGLDILETLIKYQFLLKQLVSRDFKTKYKRSVLGVIWSFLNPLLTMSVQYIVFSTIFKSDIENFPVYLLTGIICFNFFTEATGMALTSIVGNAALITKVYVPKYIYPVSRVFSSAINLLLSLIPLLIMVVITKTKITLSIFLLAFILVNLIIFTIGVGFMLASAMVFFRDTQFLWGVVSLLWMYMTPVFYPVSIIPDKFIGIYKLNPLYHFISFARVVIMQGISPGIKEYIVCAIAAIITLIGGFLVFRKTQDKFVLNI